MKKFLVGGAVRDALLGLPVAEKDWVVVGSSPEAMLALGFLPVGKSFPVFLHPTTNEEYALARTEKKVGKGYQGFQFYADPSVTLTEDLKRRDLTINAIAQTPDGKYIDPYGGQQDLRDKCLRHVSVAFAEDPVRVLRIARFSAKFPSFSIHKTTLDLLNNIVLSGEIDSLVPERVWKECEKALAQSAPINFFKTLAACGALNKLFPFLSHYAQDTESLHPQAFLSLQRATTQFSDPKLRFAALLAPLPLSTFKTWLQTYRVPKSWSRLCILATAYKKDYQTLLIQTPRELRDFIKKIDARRRPKDFLDFLHIMHILYLDARHDQKCTLLQKALGLLDAIDFRSLQSIQPFSSEDIAKIETHALEALCAPTE